MKRSTAHEIHKQFLQGERTAESIAADIFAHIETYNNSIGAFLTVLKDRTMEKAQELDRKRKTGKPLGALAGVPIAVKDNIHIKNEMTTCGSKFLTNYRAPFSATVTHLLEDEDALLVGKTNLDEFAMGSSTENSALLKTKNPWNLHCTPGGSSGGSAAAVAARMVPLSLGSDTGGSIRQPASHCGVVGFKPTYGRVSRFGLVAFGSSLDQIGPFATNARDIAMIMEVIGKHCERDSTSYPDPAEPYLDHLHEDISGLKVGVPREFLEGLSDESRKLFNQSLETLQSLGATLVDIDLSILKHSIATYYILATAEASTNLARFDGVRYGQRAEEAKTLDEVYDLSRENGFGPEVKRRILLGTYVLSAGYQDAYYKQAQKVRTLIIQKYREAFQQCNIVATPVTTSPAFEIGSILDPLQMYHEDLYTIGANLGGLPAISTPMGFSKEGLPLGVMFTGPQKGDVRVCQIAHAFEQNTGYTKQFPQLEQEE